MSNFVRADRGVECLFCVQPLSKGDESSVALEKHMRHI